MKSGKHVILCIDDDATFRGLLRRILEGEGYAVAEAATAEDGLKQYRQVQPDLVIVDLMMEEIDSGVSFVKEIKALGAKIPIYMLSGVGDTLNINVDYSKLGLTGVLQKPVEPRTLLATMAAKLK